MITPLVTIITPVKNNVTYIETCIQSVLGQSYSNIEHFIIDGASDDGTLEIIKNYQTSFPHRIKYISELDKGFGDAWVKGLRESKGNILSVLGADDTLEPNAITIIVDYFNNNPASSFVFGGCNIIDENGKFLKQMVTREFDLDEAINDMCSIPATSAFYKREVIDKVNTAIITEQPSEIEFWLSVAEKFKIFRIEPVLSNFRIHSNKMHGGKKRKDGFYIFASTTWKISRKHGASLLSPCARRYYLALLLYPLSPIIDPIFLNMVRRGWLVD